MTHMTAQVSPTRIFFKIVNNPAFLPLLSAGLISCFFIWLYLTFVPVMIVEAKYLAFKATAGLGIEDPRSLFIPSFKTFDLRANSQYQDYGITIPSLNLDEPVVFNVDPNDEKAYGSALRVGIAHASGTAFPDNAGLGYYFAHSSNPSVRQQFNAVFYLLGKLSVGDEVYIWHENKRHDYVVSKTEVTNPENVEFLTQNYDQETIVMQTCWPPGTTSQRLLVFAERKAY